MIWSDAVEQARAIRRMEVSSLELANEYLERIDRLDPSPRSFVLAEPQAGGDRAWSPAVLRGPTGRWDRPRRRPGGPALKG